MGEERDDEQTEEPIEGVRLVNKAEAEAALESGAAISRQSQGRLVSIVDMESDEPGPTWADTDDHSSSMRILSSSGDRVSAALRMPESVRAASVTGDSEFDYLDLRGSAESHDEGDDKPIRQTDPDRLIVGESAHQMPHWTEAPSGEVPAILNSEGEKGGGSDGNGESTGPHWSLDDLGEASRLGESDDDPDAAFNALGETPAIEPDGSETPPDEQAEMATVTVTQDKEASGKEQYERHTPIDTIEEKVESLKKASIVTRSATAIVAVILAIAAFSAGPAWALLLSLVVVMLAAVEYFDALRRVGYRPATALGLVAVAGAILGTYARGEAAIPLVFALTTAFTFLWYLTGIIKDSPTANISVTLLGVMWTGIFGSYAALLLKAPHQNGIAFLGAAVILVIVYDTFAYLGGVLIGQHKLIPSVSPGKTWEGLVVATVASVLVGFLVLPHIHPWGYFDGLVMGLVVAVIAPLGDLAESMVKRDLGLKDMGRLLPGHGGALDRFDALLFVLPATYYTCRMLNLV